MARLAQHSQRLLPLQPEQRLQPQLPHSLQPQAGRQRQLRRFPLLLGDRILRVVQLRPPEPRCLAPKRLPRFAAGRQSGSFQVLQGPVLVAERLGKGRLELLSSSRQLIGWLLFVDLQRLEDSG